jgi:hypothetical protein
LAQPDGGTEAPSAVHSLSLLCKVRIEMPRINPVRFPTKYETVVNLKTAKAIGLTVPPGMLEHGPH